MPNNNNNPAIITLRWIAFLPAAFAGAIIAHFIGRLFTFLSSSLSGNDSWFTFIINEFIANGIFGAAFVFAGCSVAPSQRKAIAMVLGGILLFLSGASFFISIAREEWITIWAIIAMNAGSGTVVYSIFTDEIDFD